MTSNLGTEYVRRNGALGFIQKDDTNEDREAHEKIDKALKGTFRPEFLNRIDEIVMFSPLTLDQMQEIVTLQMKEIHSRLDEHGLKVELTPAAREWLASEGFSQNLGARPIKRALQKYVESPLSISLLSGEYASGDTVIVDLDTEKKEIYFRKKEVKKAEK
jgi:ATP-dependent Clp protease ATP-binding subunit ClpC